MVIDDEKLDSIFDDVAKRVRTSVCQPRTSIIRDSRRRISQNCDDVAAIHVLAAAKLRDRRPGNSLSILYNGSSALTGNATGQRLAGYACLAQKQPDAAMQHFDQAVRIDPSQFDSWTALGAIQEKAGQHEAAISYYQRGLVFDDRNHESALALCRIYAARNDLKSAIHTLRTSLFRDRRSARLHSALARLLEKRANLLRRLRKWPAEERLLQEAVRCLCIVASSAPTAESCVSLGMLQQRLGRHDDSVQAFRQAVQQDGQSTAALTQLANAHVERGEIDQARHYFHRSLAIDPDRASTHFRYSRARKFEPGSSSTAYVETLTQLASESDRPIGDQVHLNFALAKVLDDLGDYDGAWQHYDRGNRLKPGHGSRSGRSPINALHDVVTDAVRVYSRDFFQSRQGGGSSSRTPVFIVGMPRSGTTLTEQILSSHRDIAGAGELKLIERIRQQIVHEQRPPKPTLQRGLSSSAEKPSTGRPAESVYPEIMVSVDDRRIQAFATQYLSHIESLRGGRRQVTDKMPTNFLHLGLIALLFPNATIIHCRRNPMDVLVSCYCQNLSAPFCDLQSLLSYHREYRRLMAHWQSVLPLNIHTVDYESLVTDPEPNSRRMVEHCGLTWDPQCLAFHENSRSVHTPSKWQVRQPLYSSSIDRWKRFAPHVDQLRQQIDQELATEAQLGDNPR